MTGLRILILAALTVFAVGCGDSGGSQDPSTPVQTDGSLVSYTRTGGVGGVDESLRIDPDGSAVVTIGAPEDARRSFELSAAQLDHVRSLLDAADFNAMPANPMPTGCADCFVYTVEYGGHAITYDDASPPPPSIGALVAGLGDLAEANHPAGAGFIKGG